MFFTVFSAVLLALLVFRLLTNATSEQKEWILNLIRWIFILWLVSAIIIWISVFVYSHWSWISNLLEFLLGFLLIWLLISLPIWSIGMYSSWRRFKERKKLWLIKDGVKRWDFNDEFEKKRYKALNKQQKEKEDKRANSSSRTVLWVLITIPLLLLAWSIALYIWSLLDGKI